MISEIIKKATGKNLETVEIAEGHKITDGTYTLTRGDAGRIVAGFLALDICARVSPGRFQKIWIKPSDR